MTGPSTPGWRALARGRGRCLAEPGLTRLLANPAVARGVAHALLEQVAGDRRHGRPARLLQLLVRARPDRAAARGGPRVPSPPPAAARASPRPPSPAPRRSTERRSRRSAQLAGMTGGRVEVSLCVDPELLGGVQVRLGDRLIDGSVRGRLERLRSKLASGAL